MEVEAEVMLPQGYSCQGMLKASRNFKRQERILTSSLQRV